MTVPKEWEIDDAAVEELRKVLPRYPSSLARAIASEAAHDFNDEHYASDAEYTLAQWFDAALNRDAELPSCQLHGPGECQKAGKCMSVACVHYNKTECRPRMTVLAQVDGILYPKVNQ